MTFAVLCHENGDGEKDGNVTTFILAVVFLFCRLQKKKKRKKKNFAVREVDGQIDDKIKESMLLLLLSRHPG